VLADRIVDKFGEDTFRIIEEEPERLAEIRGITTRKAMDISTQLEEKKDMRDVMIFLQGYGISPTLSNKIYTMYGQKVYDIIKTNPYKLADDLSGIGFKTADEIARRAGVEVNASIRIKSGRFSYVRCLSENRFQFLAAQRDFFLLFLSRSAVLQCLLPRGRDTAARIHQSARPVFLLRHDISRHTGGQRG